MAYTITIKDLTQEQMFDLERVLNWGGITYKTTHSTPAGNKQ